MRLFVRINSLPLVRTRTILCAAPPPTPPPARHALSLDISRFMAACCRCWYPSSSRSCVRTRSAATTDMSTPFMRGTRAGAAPAWCPSRCCANLAQPSDALEPRCRARPRGAENGGTALVRALVGC